jgi:hypothetical protein
VKIIRLNEHIGWEDSDLSFLTKIPCLCGVDVFSENVTDVSPLFELKKIKTLSLFCKAKVSGDFSALRYLEKVGLLWRNAFKSIFNHGTLHTINIIEYPDENLGQWITNRALRRLRLESRKLNDLNGINHFPCLRNLHLFNCRKLKSIDALRLSASIQELRISRCPAILDWTSLSSLTELRVLEIADCQEIESISPILKCQRLERLQIAGDTKILDGDLSGLASLPKLQTVLLASRKHYSHRAEELEHL